MTTAPIPLTRRRFLETGRGDVWWVQPLVVFVILASFVVYATWAAFQNAHYTFGPYLSPFYSPELFGDSPHAWFGPKPGWWPGWLPFSPALIILPFPGLFRFTCYYYRGSYYKAFWAAPPACAVGEPRKTYRGERYFPLVFQNIHRYFMATAVATSWRSRSCFSASSRGTSGRRSGGPTPRPEPRASASAWAPCCSPSTWSAWAAIPSAATRCATSSAGSATSSRGSPSSGCPTPARPAPTGCTIAGRGSASSRWC